MKMKYDVKYNNDKEISNYDLNSILKIRYVFDLLFFYYVGLCLGK